MKTSHDQLKASILPPLSFLCKIFEILFFSSFCSFFLFLCAYLVVHFVFLFHYIFLFFTLFGTTLENLPTLASAILYLGQHYFVPWPEICCTMVGAILDLGQPVLYRGQGYCAPWPEPFWTLTSLFCTFLGLFLYCLYFFYFLFVNLCMFMKLL